MSRLHLICPQPCGRAPVCHPLPHLHLCAWEAASCYPMGTGSFQGLTLAGPLSASSLGPVARHLGQEYRFCSSLQRVRRSWIGARELLPGRGGTAQPGRRAKAHQGTVDPKPGRKWLFRHPGPRPTCRQLCFPLPSMCSASQTAAWRGGDPSRGQVAWSVGGFTVA